MNSDIKDIMANPQKSSSEGSILKGLSESFASSTLSAMNVSKSDYPQVEVKKRVNEFDADTIYDYIQKYSITDVNLSNLQKLHERELINVPFFQKLRSIFGKQMIKSHLMDALGISKSYTGFHEYIKCEREDIPNAGLCNIAKKVGYNVMTIPVPEDLTDTEYRNLCAYRDGFIAAVDKMVKESNIPVTRAKPNPKDKPKYINTELIAGLAFDSDKIMTSITDSVTSVSEEDRISADEVFQDTSDPIELDQFQPTVQQMDEEALHNFSLDNGDHFKIGEVGNLSGLSGLNSFDDIFGSLEEPMMVEQPLTTKVDMSGYEDTFEDFKKIDEDALNKAFFEDEESSTK